MSWQDEQVFELNWHGNCVNSYWEETKQQVYAKRMGLVAQSLEGKYPVFDLEGLSVLDIGGGPYSLLLKCINVDGSVYDPCDYPEWVTARYEAAGIFHNKIKGEEIGEIDIVDEVWIYNVLQHTDDPEKIIKNALKNSRIVRIFEWIDMPPEPGHPHTLTEKDLNKWLGGIGKTEQLDESGCHGKAYFGIFKGNNYEKV